MADVKYITSNLVDFESAIDMDMAIVDYMLSTYKHSKYFKFSVLNASSLNVLKNILLFRDNINPITVLLKPEYMDSADDLYKELMEYHYEEILERSTPTTVLKYVKTLNQTNGVIVSTINCKNKLQQQLINTKDATISTCIENYDMSEYSCLFVKSIEDIFNYKNFGGKYIFLSNFKFNLDEAFFPKPKILLITEYNMLRLIDPYAGITVPKGEIKNAKYFNKHRT
jgi:hypothetical protein